MIHVFRRADRRGKKKSPPAGPHRRRKRRRTGESKSHASGVSGGFEAKIVFGKRLTVQRCFHAVKKGRAGFPARGNDVRGQTSRRTGCECNRHLPHGNLPPNLNELRCPFVHGAVSRAVSCRARPIFFSGAFRMYAPRSFMPRRPYWGFKLAYTNFASRLLPANPFVLKFAERHSGRMIYYSTSLWKFNK